MAFTFHHRGSGVRAGDRVALFPGAWNPPTSAHLALARAGLGWAGEVVWVIPRVFPHKGFEGASLEDRIGMLRMVAACEDRFSVATTDRGLYLEMAGEAREWYGADSEIGLICGRDAAERIANWDYGRPGVFEAMVERHPLLVAARRGEYSSDSRYHGRIVQLPVDGDYDEVSSTEVRERVANGGAWEELVPVEIREYVRGIYQGGATLAVDSPACPNSQKLKP